MRPPKLPPDPDGYNDRRAAWAAVALDAFKTETRLGAKENDLAVSDLICDIAHWCDRNKVNFELALTRAAGHYAVETDAP